MVVNRALYGRSNGSGLGDSCCMGELLVGRVAPGWTRNLAGKRGSEALVSDLLKT
jgi:hypothetical protein